MANDQRETGVDGALGQWDPLAEDKGDIGILAAAKKREIQNILKSYTGYYDLFAELIQNALDAVERRLREEGGAYKSAIWVTIDLRDDSVTVTDNGCRMNVTEFKSFLRPNFSFKDGVTTRGSKGVGATYLAYGFNHLSVATKQKKSPTYKGVLTDGRKWLDDRAQIVNRPLVADSQTAHPDFDDVDCGTSMTVRLVGDNIRPHDLRYYKATTAEQWMAILRVHTSLGGIYLCGVRPTNNVMPAALQIRRQAATGNPQRSTFDQNSSHRPGV